MKTVKDVIESMITGSIFVVSAYNTDIDTTRVLFSSKHITMIPEWLLGFPVNRIVDDGNSVDVCKSIGIEINIPKPLTWGFICDMLCVKKPEIDRLETMLTQITDELNNLKECLKTSNISIEEYDKVLRFMQDKVLCGDEDLSTVEELEQRKIEIEQRVNYLVTHYNQNVNTITSVLNEWMKNGAHCKDSNKIQEV